MLNIPTKDYELISEALRYRWDINAREKQQLPDVDFFVWLVLAGRGFGKTRTGAETTRGWIRKYPMVNLVGATADDARDIMIEGESGILAVCTKAERPLYIPSKRKLEWPNGATSLIFTADEPERLRGKQHMKVWADELAAWRYEEAWSQTMFGLRLGDNPQAIVTTTPRPTPIIKELVSNPKNVVTVGTTYENRANLATGFFDYVIKKYEGTTLGQQELLAQILTDNPAALWKRENIDKQRLSTFADFSRVVVGVDPTGSATGDEAGVVTAGTTNGEDIHVLADDSKHGTPLEWATAAIMAYNRHNADLIVAEKNFGGDMVEAVIKQVDPRARVKLVTSSRGKALRAAPIAAIYEKGLGHHIGLFAKLEDEMCMWMEGEDSPNRMDALVFAGTELTGRGEAPKPRQWQG